MSAAEKLKRHFRKLFFPETYEPFRLSRAERSGGILLGLLAGILLGLLFFDALPGCLIASLTIPLVLVLLARRKLRLCRLRMLTQLADYIESIAALLRSGYALENAMSGAAAELIEMYGKDSLMGKEAENMCRKLRLRLPPEQVWREFAAETGLKEGRELSRIFRSAKRQGGDYLPILRSFSRALEIRAGLREETQTLLSGQKLEYFIMCLFPLLILVYLRLAAPQLVSPLYRSGGHILMLLFLLFYFTALLWGNRILEKAHEAF